MWHITAASPYPHFTIVRDEVRHMIREDSQRRTGRHLPPVPKKAPGPVPYSTQTLADMEVERKLDVSMPLTIETHEKPIPLPRQMKLCEARSPQMTVHRIGHISLPQKAAEYMAVEGYSGKRDE
ncbi:unnamed protein product [Toxocara canis]|uniref:ZM domain-containing protein n=1 Tax=Toxocara canis TaxID=6265 RepID=A0A183TX89_TOXCA|nr:unnamed protein product [Toxocara canis]